MPDESTNPVGTTQTSQNDQVTTNQTGNDFTLDFGGGENKAEGLNADGLEISDTSLDGINENNVIGGSGSEIDLGFADDTQEGDSQENNINIQDLDSLFNEKQNEESGIFSDNIKQEYVEDKEEGNEVESVSITSNEENITDNIQEQVEETDSQEFNISLDDTKQDMIEEEENSEELQKNENDEFISLDEEEIIDKSQQVEEIDNNELIDSEEDQEKFSENDNLPEFKEVNEIDENIEQENIGDGEDNLAKGDDFSGYLDENDDSLIKDSEETKETETYIDNEISGDVSTTEESETGNNENSDKISGTDSEQIYDEVNSDNNEDTQEINVGTTENVVVENELSSDQEDSSEEKIEETVEDDVNIPEVGDETSELGDENEYATNSTEIADNEYSIDETPTEVLADNEINDNKEEDFTQIDIENTENQDKQENFIMDFNLEDDTNSKTTNQSETGDNSADLFTETGIDDNKGNSEDESLNTTEESSFTEIIDDINEITSNQETSQSDVSENDNESSDISSQDFTLDYMNNQDNEQEKNQNDNMEVDNSSEVQNDNQNTQQYVYNLDNNITQESPIENNNTEQDLSQTQVDQVNKASESIISENVDNLHSNVVMQPEIATLSLDQILDSELNSNPQYADNSKAVPKNVPLNSGFFNKKTIGIMAVTLILGGFVAVLAFPSKKTEKKDGDIVQYTGTQLEEQNHYVGYEPTEGTEEYTETGIDTEKIVDDVQPNDMPYVEDTTEVNNNNPKIDEFPDRDPGEDDIVNPTIGKEEKEEVSGNEPTQTGAVPYNCIDDECVEDLAETPEITVTIDDIESVISEYKSVAEKYYNRGDEYHDKKTIKYSLQIINLCDIYQSQVEAGKENTQEKFQDFKFKIKGIISKIEKNIGGGGEVETYIQGNFNDEYDWDGKKELQDFINENN